MKAIFALCAAVLVAGGVYLYRATRLPTRFGDFGGAPAVAVSQLVANPKAYLHKRLAVDGVVSEQCTSMGCYFFFHDGDKTLRVDIAGVAMTAPRKNGHRARVEGQVMPYGDGYEFSASAVEFQ